MSQTDKVMCFDPNYARVYELEDEEIKLTSQPELKKNISKVRIIEKAKKGDKTEEDFNPYDNEICGIQYTDEEIAFFKSIKNVFCDREQFVARKRQNEKENAKQADKTVKNVNQKISKVRKEKNAFYNELISNLTIK